MPDSLPGPFVPREDFLSARGEGIISVNLRKEIIQLRDELNELASACDQRGMKVMANSVRYIVGRSIERGALG